MRPTLAGPLAAALLLAIFAALAGCDYPDPAFQLFQKKFSWSEERTLAAGWIPPRDIQPEPAYCYHTIGKPDCYASPAPLRERSRLIGSYEFRGY